MVFCVQGGKASGFANVKQEENQGKKESYLLHIRGTSRYDTKAVEVTKKASSLNSNDVFGLFTKTAVYIWAGKVTITIKVNHDTINFT